MKNLRLVWKDEQENQVDITLPVETWIADWWFACSMVPSNDTVILTAELDKKPVLSDVKAADDCHVEFEEIARHFGWDELYYKFVSKVARGRVENDSDSFEAWLKRSENKERYYEP